MQSGEGRLPLYTSYPTSHCVQQRKKGGHISKHTYTQSYGQGTVASPIHALRCCVSHPEGGADPSLSTALLACGGSIVPPVGSTLNPISDHHVLSGITIYCLFLFHIPVDPLTLYTERPLSKTTLSIHTPYPVFAFSNNLPSPNLGRHVLGIRSPETLLPCDTIYIETFFPPAQPSGHFEPF